METEVLETITEGLQKSRSELLEQNEGHNANRKGKAKATEQDNKEAEFRRKIEDLDNAILDIRDHKQDILYKVTRKPIYATLDPDAGPISASMPSESSFAVCEGEDEGPLWNPFTNSYAYRETGFEPGPSGLNGNSRQHQQVMKKEREAWSDASPETNSEFAGPSPLWMQYSEQPQHEVLGHSPHKPVEVKAKDEPSGGSPPASTELRKFVAQDLDSRDTPISWPLQGYLASLGNIVQSCGRWLFGAKSTANATNQGSSSPIKSPSRLGSYSSMKLARTPSGSGLLSASMAITHTPRSSISLASSTRDILRRDKRNIRPRRLPSHSDSTDESAKFPARDVSPRPPSSAFPPEPQSTPYSGTLHQRPEKSMFPQSQRLPLQQQEQGSDQEWYTLEQQERNMQQTWSEDESLLLALALEDEDKAKTDKDEVSQRLALRLQLQEERELAETQEVLEKAWLQDGRQSKAAVLTTERRAAAEAERSQQDFQAQEAVMQADVELAARLNDSDRAIQSDREVAELLQVEIQ